MPPGDTFSRRFRSEGTFRYHCTIHASMRGTIVVT
jgi:plastocyanin